MTIEIGMTGHAEWLVGEEDLATRFNQLPGDGFPPVFATANMIGLMELAASRALHAGLKTGELSVGVSVDVSHTAATSPGAKVSATARLTAIEGKLYVFEVFACDPAGEIGRGVHKRAIVSTARLTEGAAKRKAAGADV